MRNQVEIQYHHPPIARQETKLDTTKQKRKTSPLKIISFTSDGYRHKYAKLRSAVNYETMSGRVKPSNC